MANELVIDLKTQDNSKVIKYSLNKIFIGLENIPCKVENTDLIISMEGTFSNNKYYPSLFSGKSKDQIKKYFAKKIKQIVQEEVGGKEKGWKRNNIEECYSIGNMPVYKCYQCYDFLMDRPPYQYGHEDN